MPRRGCEQAGKDGKGSPACEPALSSRDLSTPAQVFLAMTFWESGREGQKFGGSVQRIGLGSWGLGLALQCQVRLYIRLQRAAEPSAASSDILNFELYQAADGP